MGGSSTFGFETKDGSICYIIFRDYVFMEDILPVFRNGKVYEFNADMMKEVIVVHSIDEYFSESRYEDEDSVVRGIYRLDGTILYKFWGDDGKFVYYPK